MNLRQFCVFTFLASTSFAVADQIKLGDLKVNRIEQDWGSPKVDMSVDGHGLSIGGVPFAHGIGTHANSVWLIDTAGQASRFQAKVGVDDEVKDGKGAAQNGVIFEVLGDGKQLFASKAVHVGDAAQPIDVDLAGVKVLTLRVELTNEIAHAHADWADGTITYQGEKPKAFSPPPDSTEILTPKAPDMPRINGAKVVGVRPNHSLIYMVAATGNRPMKFFAEGLPDGLKLNMGDGLISGKVSAAGTYNVKLKAVNALGTAEGTLRIVVGDKIALTPPMGWNSWNCFASDVSDAKVRAAADAMVSSGLINHGWTYINVDDCWEIKADEPAEKRRAADGHILTNEKFPDMKALADYIHSKGMRAGLYSSPGPATCGNFTASYQYEENDAHQYAQWGFDYLKYDWCSYGSVASEIQKAPNPPSQLSIFQHPYEVMRDALAKQDRDILFSFCQYGMGDVWKWGEQAGGNCWRTTGDINDNWHSMSGIGFSQNGHEKYAGPGHWNDPDMLVVGQVGWGPKLHPTKLTPNEQYTHISLWSLLSSPLLIGCDMTQMDDFTLGLLTNDEVIAVNQDSLGKPAGRVSKTSEGYEVWARDLEDGSKAVGLFNRTELPAEVPVKWSDLGINTRQNVRDLWRQKNLGVFDQSFKTMVARHGVVLIKISPTPE